MESFPRAAVYLFSTGLIELAAMARRKMTEEISSQCLCLDGLTDPSQIGAVE